MKLRIQPWFTDSCGTFLNNLFKWYPNYLNKPLSVLEWGGGNSTLYFLGKGCRLLTIESDDAYIQDLLNISQSIGFRSRSVGQVKDVLASFSDYDLTILKASDFKDVGKAIFNLQDWSFIVNDGISRNDVIQTISECNTNAVVVLDNAEYCANWGKLERCAAHPERVKNYRKILRDPKWRHYLFEQNEGREGHSSADFTGWEAPHRWISGVLWPNDHLLTKLMVSHIGFPLVTLEALNDDDVNSLSQRCPFDWESMKWLVDEYNEVYTFPRTFE